jgi:hypothetical protein
MKWPSNEIGKRLTSPLSKRHKLPLAFSVASHRATRATCPAPNLSLTFGRSCFADEPSGLPHHPASHGSRLHSSGHTSEQRGPAPGLMIWLMLTCHASCGCHESRQARPLRGVSGRIILWIVFKSFPASAPPLHRRVLSPSLARLHRGPDVVPPEGDLHWPPCCAGFFREGRKTGPNSRAQKKDYENEYKQKSDQGSEPSRTVEHEHGEQTKNQYGIAPGKSETGNRKVAGVAPQ